MSVNKQILLWELKVLGPEKWMKKWGDKVTFKFGEVLDLLAPPGSKHRAEAIRRFREDHGIPKEIQEKSNA